MLILRPFGMTAEVAARIIQAWDNNETHDDFFIEDWCDQTKDGSRLKLLNKLKVYRTPGDIASFSRGWHDAIARHRPLAYLDHHGFLINTVPDKHDFVERRMMQPRGWNPRPYIEGWGRGSDMGEPVEGESAFDVVHYRLTTADGGNNALYVREMSFDRRKGERFDWNRIHDYISSLAPNAIDHLSVDYLRGRTMGDEVLELPYPGYHKEHDVGFIRARDF